MQKGAANWNRPGRSVTPIVGESPAFKRQLSTLEDFALADAPIYVYGETGTGKELIAKTIHALSPRARQPFIGHNCAAVPDTLVQSFWFGHRRGAFTGADRDQIGVFEAADGGTLLLDEISEMSPSAQTALLRVLQEKEVTRLGDVAARRIDVRIISASNAPLDDHVDDGRFRRDLFFRLTTLRVDLPPLRERRSDVSLLVHHFIRSYNARTGKGIAGIEPRAMEALEAYQWPGNVRQVESEVERACVLTAAGEEITVASLSPQVQGHRRDRPFAHAHSPETCNGQGLPEILAETERSLLLDALRRFNGNKTNAARALGISRQRFSQRLRKWRL